MSVYGIKTDNSGAYNTIRIAPQGRFAMIGGFGNMNGNVVMWGAQAFQ